METWFHIFIVLVAILIIYLVLNFIIDKFSTKNKIKINLLKSIIIGLAIPVVAVWLWYGSSNNNPINEYLLITKSKTTPGFITNAEQHEEEVEANDGRTSGIKYSFSYDYTFTLPNGKIINSYGVEDGSRLPDNMQNVATKPYKVEIQYLPNNPEVSRVEDFLWHNSTVYEWIRFNILLGLIILIVCICIGFAIIKAGMKKYSTEIKSVS